MSVGGSFLFFLLFLFEKAAYAALRGIVALAHGLAEGLQCFLLLSRQVGGHLNLHRDELVAPAPAPQLGDALAPQTESGARLGAGGFACSTTAPCSRCHGSGRIIHSPCRSCGGVGNVRKKTRISVTIPAGIDDGQAVSLRGEGSAGKNGGPAGDLIIGIRIKPHPKFQRDGTTVLYEHPISFCQAALGAEIEVPTLDGKVRYSIPEGTQTGTTFRLKNKGIPYVGYKNRGDQYVTVVVETPTKLTKEQRELLKKLDETMDDNGQPKRKSFFEKIRDSFDRT